ncbi:MAG: ATP-binding cassette domain-containing protein, partial [Anaerolineales bacterium]|nr:ATP-binding cassette domain-containing protein [Anaerolineales bacterium]
MSASIAATTCPNCQQHLAAEGMLFCPNCGVNLDVWEVTAVSQTPTNYQTTANVITLHKSPLFIGRTDSNDIPLSHPAVSEQHARLEWRPEAEAWFVVDEGSAKGTYINYQKVPQGTTGQVIQPEIDTLWIAPYAFRLKTGQDQNQSSQNFEAAHLRLDARDLVRTVKHKSKDNRLQNLARRLKGQGSSAGLQILNLEPTPLSFRPGEFIALVGGSGAGKTTLMKALLGLEVAQNGTVFVSERPFIIDGQTQQFAAMHSIVGYVPQDDIVHRQLTSLEALDVIARFRLAPDLTKQERLDCIKETLEIVELWPHRDKLISQLSGGQRKRVNIALELLAEPRLLFLDEPTSGLDPGLDLVIMEILRKWATKPEDPRTIILVTHATENVTNCKYVAFLASGGYVVYFGPPQKALTYFGVDRFAEIYRQVDQYQLPELLSNSHGKANSPAPPDVVELVTRFQGSKDYFQFVQSRKLEDTAVST